MFAEAMFTETLFHATADIWEAYYEHPFIKGIERGDLAKEKFQFYMIQDYLYLWDYAKLFALGALKSEDRDLISSFASSMDYILNGEMEIHRNYMRDLGIDDEQVKNTERSMTNLSYTNYMLSVAQKGGYEEVVAALLSCAWTYAVIAEKIDERNPNAKNHEFYGRWVQGYISEDFQANAEEYKRQMNDIGKYLSPQHKKYLVSVFKNCCLYELKFWDMAYNEAFDFQAEN